MGGKLACVDVAVLRKRIARAVVVVLIAGGVVAGGMAAASWWIGRQTRGLVYREAARVPERYVAIVPGARVTREGEPYPSLEDRLHAALELHRAGKVRRILVSGDHRSDGYDEVNGMARWLRARGVPEGDLFLDHAGLRTHDTMQRAARVFRVREAVVCTQAFHLPRSVWLARQAGIDAVGLVADRRQYRKARLDAVRETFARTKAVLDIYVLRTEPRFLGDEIPIDGDARRTHDRWTQR